MDLIYWWRHSERPGIYSPAVPLTKLHCAKCHCSLWLMMGNVRWGISLSPAVFTISYFTACCALSENPNKTLWNQQLCHSHPVVQWIAMWSTSFPQGLQQEVPNSPLPFPTRPQTLPLCVLRVTVNKLILGQIHMKNKDWFPLWPSPVHSPQSVTLC